MEIASNFTAQQWHDLQLDPTKQEGWVDAIAVVKRRISERYIEPVDVLLELEADKNYKARRFGFSVLAIDCLLIETLQSFIDGTIETKRGKGKKVFVDYLAKGDVLKEHFNEELAGRFYEEYRNGLLHQGETKNKALIWSQFEVVSILEDQMIINRTEMHKLISKQFDNYLESLQNIENIRLRENLIKKMDYIAKL